MAGFREKAIFIWNDTAIGDAAKVIDLLKAANFEAAYLHSTNLTNWRTTSRVALANALKAAGITVHASVAVYGYDPASEGVRAAQIVNEYDLAGMVFDIEAGAFETSDNAGERARSLFTAYKANTAKPSAFCGWPYYLNSKGAQIHPLAVLQEAMALADVGMPMAYWYNGDNAYAGRTTAETSFGQWRKYTTKPIVMAGRAYNDQVIARGEAVTAFDSKSRELGACGLSWWVMDQAIKIPDVWNALTNTPKMGGVVEPPKEEPMAQPIGLFTRAAGWTVNNPNFNFVAGAAQVKGTCDPNPAIKPIELEAAAGKIPFLLYWDHLPWLYSEQQWGENNWPDEDSDYIFQNFKKIMEARSYQAVVISVMTYEDKAGKEEDKGFVAFSAKSFLDRVQGWLKANRPLVPLILATSNDFIRLHAPNIANWAHNFESMAVQPTTLSGSYPLPGAKPAYLGNSAECPWWRYYEMTDKALMLFRGANGYPADTAGMASWLNYNQEPKPPVEPPADNPDLAALTARIAALEAWQKRVKEA